MTTGSSPAVSVLMPFRNAAETMGDCIDSILSQTLTDYEIIAIDDFSVDQSVAVLQQFGDQRISIIDNDHQGLVPALNKGLACCRAPLVARMDADDIMYPNRLKMQYSFMRRHRDVELVATQARKFPEASVRNGYREYMRWQNSVIGPEDVNNQIYIESPFAHPSVMFRRDSIIAAGGYRQGGFPEDYELWLRLFHHGYRMEKLPEVLLDWRESAQRLSRVSENYSREAFDFIRSQYLSKDRRIHNKPLAFWGAGRKTRRRAKRLINKGFAPAVWIDIDPKKIGNNIHGVEVVEPAWLEHASANGDKPFVLNYVTNHGARDIARNYLERIGYAIGRDYLEVG
ncbi:MAG: glycosyltransferase [Gammaproteobacteria bacterium]|jgi:glycosyltransferase involved in cell wall biosynthesis